MKHLISIIAGFISGLPDVTKITDPGDRPHGFAALLRRTVTAELSYVSICSQPEFGGEDLVRSAIVVAVALLLERIVAVVLLPY